MATVLSTKKLSTGQRELLLNRGLGLVEIDFISIVPVHFEVSQLPDNIIITSKNTVRILLDHPLQAAIKEKNIFCVGEKTASFLEGHGFRVFKMANYGANLASEIIKSHRNEKFLFFCGKKRHPELPQRLRSAGVDLAEVEVYDTVSASQKIDRIFDGVMFFSPSAVKSYCSKNNLKGSKVFCIGTTTAAEARKYTDEIIIASTPSIESVIVKVVKHLENH